MKDLKLKTHPDVSVVFENYPEAMRPKIERIRNLIIETAEESSDIDFIEETLKWGEPSYLARHGSTIRVDWKPKSPDQYAIYFKCTSKLVPTFRKRYGKLFAFEGDRAIIFQLEDEVPVNELKSCISAALHYHKVKKQPDLGM